MSKVTKRLGRGLDSLVTDLRDFSKSDTDSDAGRNLSGHQTGQSTALLPLDRLDPNPHQPRKAYDASGIAELAKSIEHTGMIQPIAVRRRGDRYQIIAGERRLRAARMAKLDRVPVVIQEADDRQMLEMALAENIQREDLNAIDRAEAYRRFGNEFGLSADQVAVRTGEDRSTVANYLRLLELAENIKVQVAAGRISMGHARCLLGVADVDERARLAESVVAHGLSVRALEEIVRRTRTRTPTGPSARPAAATKSPNVRDLESRLQESVGTKVTIREGRRKGAGRIIIEYYTLDDFDRIAAMLGLRESVEQ